MLHATSDGSTLDKRMRATRVGEELEWWNHGVIRLLVSQLCHAVQVWWPWASAVWGEVQFELMMAVLWENMAEPCSFGPPQPPPFPIGKWTQQPYCCQSLVLGCNPVSYMRVQSLLSRGVQSTQLPVKHSSGFCW